MCSLSSPGLEQAREEGGQGGGGLAPGVADRPEQHLKS